MKFITKGLAALLVALLFLPATGHRAFADEAAEKRAELEQVKAQMEEMARQKEAARKEVEAASGELDQVLDQLNDLQGRTKSLTRQQRQLEKDIVVNREALAKKQEEQKQRLVIYKQRLRDIYINGSVNYLDVLLGAKDFSDFSSRMYLLQKVIAQDIALMESMKKAAEEIAKQQAVLQEQLEQVQISKRQLALQEAETETVRERRAQILYKAEEAKHAKDEEYDRLLAISENIAAMLRNLEKDKQAEPAPAAPAPEPPGKFMWPCTGEITSYYGWRTHPISGVTKYHSGMDIAVDYGTPIHAANAGTVVYSGWLGGYGYCVMINHGQGIVTLYGHNQALNVNEGQYVAKGTVIAYAGSTGYSTGPHCHFEVRLHGEVTEPLNYLP